MSSSHPCLSCGACCAFYRVSFYWTEADPFLGGTIPADMTQKLTQHRISMKGTTGKPASSRCVALEGSIGTQVSCGIYDSRGSTCREFAPSWEGGESNDRCDRARAHYGLPPLTPDDYLSPETPPLPKTA